MNYAFVSIDVNNLKMTNDTLGHAAGDKLLNTVNHIILDMITRFPIIHQIFIMINFGVLVVPVV